MNQRICPPLRPVDVQPIERDGERVFVLKDPDRLSDRPPVLTPLAGWLLRFFDGESSHQDVKDAFRRETGETLPDDVLDDLTEVLDEHLLLENERSREALETIRTNFLESNVRTATLPGASIPGAEGELRDYLRRLLPDGELQRPPDPFKGLIVPHIDFQRGRETYGKLLPYLRSIASVDRVIMLGICHNPVPKPFALSYKNFETPLGTVSVDEQAVRRLDACLPYDVHEAEIAHRLEHSIEIPLLLLQHVRPDLDLELVPLLCSYQSDDQHAGQLRQLVDQLARLLERPGNLLVAGVDFAHMGRQFGDRERLEDGDFERIERADRSMLEAILDAHAGSFEQHIQSDDNARRVCGYPALRTALPLFEEGELIDYGQWQDPEGTVSYGAALLRC